MLRSIKVTYKNGDTITTSMSANLTDKEMLNYFAPGKVFNIGSVSDNLQEIVKSEILN